MDCEGCRKALAPAVAMGAPRETSFAAVIVAAGQGLRAGQPVPKQFAQWRGKPVVRHSAEAFISAGAREVVVVIPDGAELVAGKALHGLGGVRFATGGATRPVIDRLAV